MQELMHTAVKFQKDANTVIDAIVVGAEAPREGKPPILHLAFVNAERLALLGGGEWRNALDRAWSVPHLSESQTGIGWALAPSIDAIDAREKVIAGLTQEIASLLDHIAALDLDIVAYQKRIHELEGTIAPPNPPSAQPE